MRLRSYYLFDLVTLLFIVNSQKSQKGRIYCIIRPVVGIELADRQEFQYKVVPTRLNIYSTSDFS